ncbi:hypothetical protein ACM42_02455 [Bradyrhizobium sp. CCBAU 25338]|nr:hypothetical protein [Bradyrhizobium sp. CCBAU 45389]MDA9527313.1 hypothetical protein [Bradyrhizobium sp. CCBAU 25338]RXH24302.1 hypothetical protein XH84_33015 [Bradyrhizobium nanningense]
MTLMFTINSMMLNQLNNNGDLRRVLIFSLKIYQADILGPQGLVVWLCAQVPDLARSFGYSGVFILGNHHRRSASAGVIFHPRQG